MTESVLSFTGAYMCCFHPQILTHGETHSHHATLYLKSTTLPSTSTTTWPETTLWARCIWRALMWPKQATGRLKTTDTLVSVLLMSSPASVVCLCCAFDHFLLVASQSCCRWAVACQWAVEVFQTCTTPSRCTSTGEAGPPTARSTRWTDADTQWRYSTVSRQICTVTDLVQQQTAAASLMPLCVYV